ncbi:hypothetical protein V6N11_079610 [Hibiscus sabdariffa]|uniref:Uncharacterized protein n=1 Tax=Hibiscus sabdariffa TaxID=183260 RepID=A0ABR2RVW2_9ROSI
MASISMGHRFQKCSNSVGKSRSRHRCSERCWFDFIALFNNSFLSLFDFFLEDCHWVTAMHRVGSAGNNANSNRPRNEKRLTYVLNDTADTKHCAGINCLAVPLC